MKSLTAQDEAGSEPLWSLFERTGSINAYMRYKALNSAKFTSFIQEAEPNADKDRRDYDS